MAWFEEKKIPLEEQTHKEEVLPYCEIVHIGDMIVELNLSTMPNLLLGLVGVCWD